jgi:hypothetical protein
MVEFFFIGGSFRERWGRRCTAPLRKRAFRAVQRP